MLVPTETHENQFSNAKYMEALIKFNSNKQPPTTYWKLSENDYSDLTAKLKLQKMNK